MALNRTPVPHSDLPGAAWPAVPAGAAAQLLALTQQLTQTQWWPPEVLHRYQFRQLSRIVEHAYRTIPFHRARLDSAGYRPGDEVSEELWRSLPVLTRREVQDAGAALEASEVPQHHGGLIREATSGSTGSPVRYVKTQLAHLYWLAMTLRDELWQRRDFGRKLAIIRRDLEGKAFPPEGRRLEDWGPPVAMVFPTGPAVLCDPRSTIEELAQWVLRERPDYIFSFATIILELARWFRGTGTKPPPLAAVRTFGEMVGPDLRLLCREVFGVGVSDVYSAADAGYLGLQCPDHEHHHVPAESVYLEVLDAAGRLCGPGELGTVVVTSLHNYAMPLLRYEIGDFAEPGPPCPCGRSLPVLARVVGKTRDIVVLPTGERRPALMRMSHIESFRSLQQIQIVQKSVHDLEARLVTRGELGAENEERLRAILQDNLGSHFRVAFTYHDRIPRSEGGKYFDFISEVAG